MSTQKPSIGRTVHVVRPTHSHRSVETLCLPAVIDALLEPDRVSLTILNRGTTVGVVAAYDESARTVNTWHWPERVD